MLTINPGITVSMASCISFILGKGYRELFLNKTNQSKLLLVSFWGEGCLHHSHNAV